MSGSLVDFDIFKEEFKKLASIVRQEMLEAAKKYGFVDLNNKSKVTLYNKCFDMEIVISIRKKSKTEFV